MPLGAATLLPLPSVPKWHPKEKKATPPSLTWIKPRGIPAASNDSWIRSATSGVCGDGFRRTELPATRAGMRAFTWIMSKRSGP
jgi:hypothetical protein